MSKLVRVVVADDSPFIRSIICSHLSTAAGFEIVGTAADGREAVALTHQLRPDVVTLDVEMPGVNGMEALDKIMCEVPTPVVMVSGVSIRAADTTMRAIKTGAVDFVLKYVPGQFVDPETLRLDLISKVRAAAGVAVVRSIPNRIRSTAGLVSYCAPAAPVRSTIAAASETSPWANTPPTNIKELVVIGASTGGPLAITELLGHLPNNFAAPIIIVQHIPKPFTEVLAAQFASQLPFDFTVVKGGETLAPRQVYLAPGDRHLLLKSTMKLEIYDGPPINGNRPSIDVAMMSIAQTFPHQSFGVLLSGMGKDGAGGLAYMKSRGSCTFAQSSETCVVDGMPSAATAIDAVNHVASPRGIAERLTLEINRAAGLRTTDRPTTGRSTAGLPTTGSEQSAGATITRPNQHV